MKKLVCLLFIAALTGCMFIVREQDSIKSVGISQEKAKEDIVALDNITQGEK